MTRPQRETGAPTLLLDTKLYVPPAPRRLVQRSRLSDRLNRGASSTLMLVSAPAGFGKTTLLAEWLAAPAGPAVPAGERLVAWVSLDRGDNHPGSFWTYVIAALQKVAPGVGADALSLLQAPQPTHITTVLTTLLNDLGATEGDLVLVLDDYHVIDAPEVQEGMAFLLDHVPPRLHLVILGTHGTSLSASGAVRAIVGVAGYLALIGVFSVALGFIVRSTGGGVAILCGLLLVVPTLGLLLPSSWREHLLPYLPSNAGASFFNAQTGTDALSATTGLLVLLGWVAVALAGAALVLKRRDA